MKKLPSFFLLFAIILVLGGSPRRFKSLASGAAITTAPHGENNTNFEDRDFHTYYFVRFRAQFFCYDKPYGRHPDGSRVKVTFYEDDGPNNHDFVQYDWLNDDGTIDKMIREYDDFFHPWLDLYLEFDFDCFCKGFYQSHNSPWDKQSKSQYLAENNPFDQGKIRLNHVCQFPSMYRQNRQQ